MLWRLCGASHAENVMSCPAVPPGEPVVRVPSSVTTGRAVTLTCHDPVGSPPSKYNWFKDGVLMPSDPSTIAAFKNATYKLNTEKGTLVRCNPLLCTISTESNFQKCNIYPVCLFRSFPLLSRWTLLSTVARLSTALGLLSARNPLNCESVSTGLLNEKNALG